MHVKIVKVNSGGCWYRVGEVWEVPGTSSFGEEYWDCPARSNGAAILKKDCIEVEYQEVVKTPVKSDGTSSSYYDLTITRKDGSTFSCTVQDIISSVLKDHWHFGNIFKAMVRIVGKMSGGGKAGTDEHYDANKVVWFAEDFKSRLPK